MSDLICRQDAISSMMAWTVDDRPDILIDRINAIPSAEPSPCEFCKHNDISDDVACLRCMAERRTDE